MSEESNVKPPVKNRASINFDLRIVVLLLLAVIVAMLLLWKPWDIGADSDRTIDVTGQAKLKAEPDEFVFYPMYQFQNANKDVALADATKKSNELTMKLKELGVADNKIKVDTSGFDAVASRPAIGMPNELPIYNLQVTINVNSKENAQKVQDYLTTTSPTGAVSPQGTFSEAKRNALEDEAREKATQDARQKAEKSAKNIGFKIGKVKSVSDGAGFDGPIIMGSNMSASTRELKVDSLPVQPGENEYNYSVSVTYYVR